MTSQQEFYELAAASQRRGIARRMATTGETTEQYTARTGIIPGVIKEEGKVVYADPQAISNLPVASAGLLPALGSLLPAIGSLIPGVAAAMPVVGGLVAAGGAIYGGLQALGLGEGGGLFGLNILGGDVYTKNGVTFGGPGIPEPQKPWLIVNEWPLGNNKRCYYIVHSQTGRRKFALIDLNNPTSAVATRVWNAPRPHLAVIGKNMPRHQMLVRLRKNLSRHAVDAKTVLKFTSPGSLKRPRRRR